MSDTANDMGEFLLGSLESVRGELEEVLERLTPPMMGWAPGAGMRTVAGQLVEIIGTEMQIVARQKDGRRLSDDEARQVIGDCDSLENLTKCLVSVREATLGYLETLPTGGIEAQKLIHSIALHEYYHVGQLTSYLWSRGDNPYEW